MKPRRRAPSSAPYHRTGTARPLLLPAARLWKPRRVSNDRGAPGCVPRARPSWPSRRRAASLSSALSIAARRPGAEASRARAARRLARRQTPASPSAVGPVAVLRRSPPVARAGPVGVPCGGLARKLNRPKLTDPAARRTLPRIKIPESIKGETWQSEAENRHFRIFGW